MGQWSSSLFDILFKGIVNVFLKEPSDPSDCMIIDE